MPRRLLLVWAILLAPGFCRTSALADNRVLILGIDGAGGGYLRDADTPNIDALIANGAVRYDWLNEGALVPNPPEGYGASGVNWSTIATGASAAHHGVVDNGFGGSHYDQYPHFFKYIEQQDPSRFTASIVNWSPINDLILGSQTADLALEGISDTAVRDATVNLLQTGDPDAIFLHFDQVDAAGHGVGWGTPAYFNALRNVDGLIGNIMAALNARPGVASGAESWLVMVTADHGGLGTGHYASQGPINWETPFVVSGDAVPDGTVLKQGTLRDVATTALWHLGVDPFGTAVDGRVVGIPFGPPNGIAGDVNQDGVVAGNGQGLRSTDDVAAFVAGWRTSGHPSVAAAYGHGDLNLDRVTDLKDWIILNRLDPAMGQAALASLSIPEPAAACLALLGAGAALAWRRRRSSLPARGRRSFHRAAPIGACVGAICLALAGGATAEAALTDGLAALYSFDGDFRDGARSPVASDGAPVNGPQFAAGKIGQGLWLPGVHDYVSLPSTAELNFGATTDFSVSMWIRQDDDLSDPAVFSNKNWNSGDNTGINWAPNGNGVFDLNTKAAGGVRRDLDTAANSASLGVGVWSLVVMTLDRDGAMKLYIGGVNTGTIPLSSQGSFNGALPWNIGQDGTGAYGVEFTGAVDELAIWRRALSAAEAGQLYNAGAGIDLAAQLFEPRLKLVVDRDTGQITIENNTGHAQSIIGYEITSAAAALDRSAWRPVAGRLDAAGTGAVDSDDRWVVLTAAGSSWDLSEGSLGAGSIARGAVVDLGLGAWQKYYEEAGDLEFLYADGASDEPLAGLIEFVGNGGLAYARGDLNFDRRIDSDDWIALAGAFGGDVTSPSKAGRYRQADLNGDGLHTLADTLEFRLAYDAANGAGAFAAMLSTVPEPATLALAVGCAAMIGSLRRRGRCRCIAALLAISASGAMPARGAVLFQENFDGVVLGPSVNESPAGAAVWSNTPPAGWSIDNSGVPSGGVAEWRGWSFASPVWWSTIAQDQGRSQFTKASGAIAVADPDEWDDLSHGPGTYNTFLRTPAISLAGAAPGTARIRFDSSWQPEGNQTATITVSYNGGAEVEVLHWASATSDERFKSANTNETVIVPLDNPAGATTARLKFGLTDAGNNWFWAIDNLSVVTPLALRVDVQTGQMTLLGDASIALTGYEISSDGGSLDGSAWRAGNLDAQNIGAQALASADFTRTGGVGAPDLAVWKAAYGASAAGDADFDGDTDGADFLRWQRQVGLASDPASTWLTLAASSKQLVEAYLMGSSTFASDVPLGAGYDVATDARDLQFRYTTLAGEEASGVVVYVNLPSAAAVPEPSAVRLAAAALVGAIVPAIAARRRRERRTSRQPG